MKEQLNQQGWTPEGPEERKPYAKPELKQVGTLAELTQGFSGSLPDEQGGMTKRNPFQG